MRIEIILFLVASGIIANIYTEGKYVKLALANKKYYQMAGVAVGALFIFYVMKKNPLNARQILSTSNDYIKYLPIDRNTSSMLSPILDFTSKHDFGGGHSDINFPIADLAHQSRESVSQNRIMSSGTSNLGQGKKATKRSVSETKKKFVAARQNWKCGDCGEQLSAWFEVDHKIRLEYGGSNHIDNLVAMCRECHGRKTTIENL